MKLSPIIIALTASPMLHAAAPVIFQVDAVQRELAWFGDLVTENTYSYLGAQPNWSSEIDLLQVVETGPLTGGNATNITSSVNGTASTFSVSSANAMNFVHGGGWPFFISTLQSSLGLGIYVLGEPGTPFEFAVSTSYTPGMDGSGGVGTIGYTSPGWAWNWGASSEQLTFTGTSNSETLTFEGSVYSKIQLGIEFTTGVELGYTSPSDPFTISIGHIYTESITVTNLAAVPEPGASAGLAGVGALAFIMLQRRKRKAA